MSEKEVNTISHLLEVEQNASALTSQAQADADKKIAAAKVQADARFQEQFAQIVSDCEASYIEKTSALDNKTQDGVKLVIDSMKSERSFLIVAHRLSTIQNCDRIIVLDQGSIAEEGNYEQLMARKGMFYQLASRQAI